MRGIPGGQASKGVAARQGREARHVPKHQRTGNAAARGRRPRQPASHLGLWQQHNYPLPLLPQTRPQAAFLARTTAPYEKILILEHIAEGSNCRLKSELWQEVLMRQAGLWSLGRVVAAAPP